MPFLKRCACIFILALLSSSQAQTVSNDALEFLNSAEGQAFLEIYMRLKENYVSDLDDATLMQGAINGMLTTLDDPYTFYKPAQETLLAREVRTGAFAGIGVFLSPDGFVPTEIAKVIQNSPAERAGLRAGDIFMKVDDLTVEELSANDIAQLTRGEVGSRVTLELFRPSEDEVLSFALERDRIEIRAVEGMLMGTDIAYIAISTFFQTNVAEQFKLELNRLQALGAKKLILDLRDNGGGFIFQAIDIADMFLTEGVIFWEREREVLTPTKASESEEDNELPLVILTNRGTASAAEVLVAALKDNRRAIIMGEPSFGKSAEGELYGLSNGGELQYTFREWLSPFFQNSQGKGIEPHHKIEDTRLLKQLNIQGTGAETGQLLSISQNNQEIGTTKVNDSGQFEFTRALPRPTLDITDLLDVLTPKQQKQFQADLIFQEALRYTLEP